MEKIYSYEREYMTNDGVVKTCTITQKKMLKGTPRGRPSKTIDPNLRVDIVEFLKTNTKKAACQHFGISNYMLAKYM